MSDDNAAHDCHACYRCEGCSAITCADKWPSPGEPDICSDCFETEDVTA